MEYEDLKEIMKVVKSESEVDEIDFVDSDWSLIPENVFVSILKYLSVKDIVHVMSACKRWNFIANDSLLWKYKFHHDFRIDKNIHRKPGKQ